MNRDNEHIEDRSGKWMTRRYVFALATIAILSMSAFGTVALLIAEYQNTLSVVNISGRQRMLSQRTALYVSQLAGMGSIEAKHQYREKLRDATNLLEQAHLALSGQNYEIDDDFHISDAARRQYFEGSHPLNARMQAYIRILRTILTVPPHQVNAKQAAVNYVLNVAPNELLQALDDMVSLYQSEGEKAFASLQQLAAIFLALTLLVLFLEAIFLFGPMVRQVSDQLQRIRNFSKELEHMVSRRTRQLEEAKQTADEANVAKSRFLAAAGHDLKQPLEAIGMFSGMLERRLNDDDSRAILNDMQNAQRSMRGLLDSILSLSKLEAGVITPHPQVFELNPMLKQLTREYRALAHDKGLSLTFVETSLRVNTDPLLLERIIRNFLSNAIRYTKHGRILLGCRRSKDGLQIEVLDTGPGIPEEGLSLIFNEFSQLDDPERDRSEGIGLGLAIVKKLADLLHLEILCKSNLGRGSRFGVKILIAPQDKATKH